HDFAGSMDSDTGLHFLGFIILTTGDTQTEHPEISDGQQRLATTTMLLAALRDYLLDMEEQDDAASIERDFLIKRDRSQGDDRPRLIMNIDDQAFFESTVLLPPKKRKLRSKDKKLKDSHRKIEGAAQIIRTYIAKRLSAEKAEQKKRVINQWIKFIEKNALVVAINLAPDLDPYMTFETMNDRGLETSQADLLKNYLFGKDRDRKTEAQEKWSGMAGKLESLGKKGIVVSFVRHLLITMHGHTKQRDVLKKVKGQITKQSQAVAFLESMDEN